MNKLGEAAIQLEQDFMDHLRSKNSDNSLESKLKSWMREEQELADAVDVSDFKRIMVQFTELGKKHHEKVDNAYHLYLIRRTDAYNQE